jgi:hypothetical protein
VAADLARPAGRDRRARRDADPSDGVFFFQKQATRDARALYWFRIAYLTVTLVFIGWYANAQLSVVNLMALAGALQAGFTWDAFLLDPLVFILWCSVAVALIFWGRGAYCGWLCPFGALQELTNQIARALKIPQWELPWGLHERLWPIKYLIFLGLFGISLASIPLAEQFAEVEPFKTAIVLKFQRGWPCGSTAAICARLARRWRSRHGCGCSPGSSAITNAAIPVRHARRNARSRRSTRPARSIPTNASTACIARCSTRARRNAR